MKKKINMKSRPVQINVANLPMDIREMRDSVFDLYPEYTREYIDLMAFRNGFKKLIDERKN